jgi:hypothetical protein
MPNKDMRIPRLTLDGHWLNKAVALFACAALLYFACGGAFLHEHSSGPETPCHICQALHMPALAVAHVNLALTPSPIARLSSIPKQVALNAILSLYRLSRAPPVA